MYTCICTCTINVMSSLYLYSIMYQGVNAVPLENYEPRGPKFFATPEASIYFVVFMIFVSSFLLSLFSGFVIVVFQEVGFKSYRQAKLDRNQVSWIFVYY